MGNTQDIIINQLPAKTWHWLRMNETKLPVCLASAPCDIRIDGGESSANPDFDRIETGAGREADAVFANAPAKTIKAAEGSNAGTIHVAVSGSTEADAGVLCVMAEAGSELTVIETFAGEEAGTLALRTRCDVRENAHMRLVQVFLQGEKRTVLNDTGCECEGGGSFDVLQIFLGKGNLLNGVRCELIGDHSETNMDIGYLGQRKQVIDVNLIVNHIGRDTVSSIQVDGTLKDAAQKIFRGSIDFKTGSSGSKGAETENVLLLGDEVVNKTIPLILCAEENVEGSHGATIGELDEETLFYFASRGIGADAAEEIMTKGKLEVLYRKIADCETEKLVERQLAEVMEYDREEL